MSNSVKNDQIIKTRQYIKSNSQTPSIISTNIYSLILNEFNYNINVLFHKPNIKQLFISIIEPKIKSNNLCTIHNIKILFLNCSFRVLMFTFISNINRLLKGEKLKALCSESDQILYFAEQYYKHNKLKKQKNLKNCNKLNIIN